MAGEIHEVALCCVQMRGGGIHGAIHRHAEISGIQSLSVMEDDGFPLLDGQMSEGADEGAEPVVCARVGEEERVLVNPAQVLAAFENCVMEKPALGIVEIAKLSGGFEGLPADSANGFAGQARITTEGQ